MNRYTHIMRTLRSRPGGRPEEVPWHLSESDLAAAEQRLGSTLPPDYREFMRDFGGFFLPAARFPMPSAGVGRAGSIEYFDEIIPQGSGDVDLITRYEAQCGISEVWPKNCLPIAYNAGSSVIGLAFKGEDQGAVYMMVEHNNVYFVASTFDEFIRMIRNVEDDPYALEDAEKFWKPYLGEE